MTSQKLSRGNKTDLKPSRETFRSLFDNHPIPMWVYDLKTLVFLDVNDAAMEKYGYTRDEFLALAIKDIRPVEDLARLVDDLEQRRPALQHSGEWRHRLKNGQVIDVEITSHTLEFKGHKAVLVTAQDVTERKRAVDALRESEEHLRLVLENSPDVPYSRKLQTNGFHFMSPAIVQMTGFTAEEMMDMPLETTLAHTYFSDRSNIEKAISESIANPGKPYQIEYRFKHKDGSHYCWLQDCFTTVSNVQGIPEIQYGTIRDITERKQAEEVVKKRNQAFLTLHNVILEIGAELQLPVLLKNILKHAQTMLEADRGGGIYLYDDCENVIRLVQGAGINQRREGIAIQIDQGVVGVVLQTSQPLVVDDYTHWEGHATVLAADPPSTVMGVPLFLNGKVVGALTLIANSNLRKFSKQDIQQAEMFAAQAAIAIQNARLYQQAQQEISERKQAEEKLHESEEKYRTVVDKANDGILIGQDGVIKFLNSSLASMLGYQITEIEGREFREFLPPENMELLLGRYQKRLAGISVPSLYETALLHKSGKSIYVEVNATVVQFEGRPADLAIMRDITERKQAEEALAESEKKLRALFETMSEGIVYEDQDGKIISANPAAERLLGLSLDQLQGRTSVDPRWKAIHEDGSPFPGETHSLNVAAKTGKPAAGEVMGIYNPKLDSYVWLSVNSTPEFLPGEKKPFRAYAVFRDITERKQAEETLRENAMKLARSQQIGKLGSWDWNIVGNSLDWSDEVYQIWGVGKDFDLTFENIAGMIHPDDRELNSKMVQEFLAQSNEGGFEFRIICPDGTIKHIYQSIEVTRASDNQPIKMFGIMQDITKRKQVETSLRESQAKLQSIMDYSPSLISIKDLNGNVILANRGFAALDAPPLNELIGNNVFDIFPREVAEQLWNNDLAALQAKAPVRSEDVVKHKDGIWHTYLTVKFPIYLQSDQPFGICAISNDITERKQAEETLRDTSERLTHMLANSPTVIYALKVEGGKANPIWVSDNINAVLGFNAEDGVKPEWWPQQIHPEDQSEVLASLEHLFDDFYQHEYRFLRKDGNVIWLHDEHRLLRDEDNKPREIIGAWTDITEHKQAEEILQGYNARLEDEVQTRTRELREAQEKLVRNEKLAVLGQLAGGVGHELRNPLAVINNALYYLKLIGADSSEKVKEYLGIIQTEARTAEKIITDLLDFARIKSVDLEPVSASKLTARVLERYPVPKAVCLTLEIPEDLPKLYVDPRQMEQVLGNLVVNACQSMCVGGVSEGGTLTITARPEQEMIAIAVKDTGVGISPENMKKLFEPLFTTKAKGIGLGLAVSQKLAEANGGRIEVQSEAGVGSTFTVYLPVKV